MTQPALVAPAAPPTLQPPQPGVFGGVEHIEAMKALEDLQAEAKKMEVLVKKVSNELIFEGLLNTSMTEEDVTKLMIEREPALSGMTALIDQLNAAQDAVDAFQAPAPAVDPRLDNLIKVSIADNQDFKAAWDAAEAALKARGVNITTMPTFDALKLMATEDSSKILEDMAEQWQLRLNQEASVAAGFRKKKGKTIVDIVGPGKPLLLTADGSGVLQIAKDTAWKLSPTDPAVLECELTDETILTNDFFATAPGSLVIFDEAHRARPEVLEVVAKLMVDPDRICIVAVRGKPLDALPPEKFAHWVKF